MGKCFRLSFRRVVLADYLQLPTDLLNPDGLPWELPDRLEPWLAEYLRQLGPEYRLQGEVAVHATARVEDNVTFHGPVYIGPGCYVKANAYFRSGVYLDEGATIGPGCEIKSSYIGRQSAIAHFNYIGNSLIGANVNFEAGSVTANHYNERENKEISVLVNGRPQRTGVTKFGALVGDGSRIGANAVLSPGTILPKRSTVGRLELVKQL